MTASSGDDNKYAIDIIHKLSSMYCKLTYTIENMKYKK